MFFFFKFYQGVKEHEQYRNVMRGLLFGKLLVCFCCLDAETQWNTWRQSQKDATTQGEELTRQNPPENNPFTILLGCWYMVEEGEFLLALDMSVPMEQNP